MKIGIIIINYNGEEDTIECLESIDNLYSDQNYLQIILVDNDPLSNIYESYVNKFNVNVCLIKNSENKGFAEGSNIGIRKALSIGCDYVALINNDTLFIDNSLINAVRILDKNPYMGIIGLINYYYNNPGKIWQSGFKSNINTGRTKSINLYKDLRKNGIVLVDYVPGSSIIIKREVINEIGLLDPRFFAYYEEYDFCVRAKEAGYNIGVLLGSKILHKVGRSSTSPTKLYLRTRNKLLFYKKHASSFGFFSAIFQHLFITIFRIVFIQQKKKLLFKAMILGIKDYFNNKFYYGSLDKINK